VRHHDAGYLRGPVPTREQVTTRRAELRAQAAQVLRDGNPRDHDSARALLAAIERREAREVRS